MILEVIGDLLIALHVLVVIKPVINDAVFGRPGAAKAVRMPCLIGLPTAFAGQGVGSKPEHILVGEHHGAKVFNAQAGLSNGTLGRLRKAPLDGRRIGFPNTGVNVDIQFYERQDGIGNQPFGASR